MANRIMMETQRAILAPKAEGRSNRCMFRELGIHRKTGGGAWSGGMCARTSSKCTGMATGAGLGVTHPMRQAAHAHDFALENRA